MQGYLEDLHVEVMTMDFERDFRHQAKREKVLYLSTEVPAPDERLQANMSLTYVLDDAFSIGQADGCVGIPNIYYSGFE